MHDQVFFIANSLDNAYRFQQVLLELDVKISAGSTAQIPHLLAPTAQPSLIIFEARESAMAHLHEIEELAETHGCPLLLIVDEGDIALIRLPHVIPSDFVVSGAGAMECKARVLRLMGSDNSLVHDEVIQVDCMAINLATYQVTVGDEPVDLTYLEYALLAFLIQHPDRTFTRDMLLQNVWGFDYYGGSRTVDVHVRRIRSKIGPKLSQHLETVRGVGYLWKSH